VKPTDLREYLEGLQSAEGSGWNPWGDDKAAEDLFGDLDEVA
jgi:hypothetical protein